MKHRVIGLLGGSFNPAHAGHVHISREALKRLGLQEVWWLVSPGNPLKNDSQKNYTQRVQSARKMAAGEKHIRVSEIEARLGTRYTADTLRALKRRFPRARFVWLMGADNLAQLPRWRQWRYIMRNIPVAVFDRAPFSHSALRSGAAQACAQARLPSSQAKLLKNKNAPVWIYLPIMRNDASSTQLRSTTRP